MVFVKRDLLEQQMHQTVALGRKHLVPQLRLPGQQLVYLFAGFLQRLCQLIDDGRRLKELAEMEQHCGLDLAASDPVHRAKRLAPFAVFGAEVVGVHHIVLFGVSRPHAASAVPAVKEALQRGQSLHFALVILDRRVGLQDLLRPLPHLVGDDPLLFAVEHVALVGDLADVGMVVQEAVNVPGRPRIPLIGQDAVAVQLVGDLLRRLDFDETGEHPPDHVRPLRVHDELLVFHLVSGGDRAADPFAFFAARGHLVPDSLGHDGPFEFRESPQNVEQHAPGRRAG